MSFEIKLKLNCDESVYSSSCNNVYFHLIYFFYIFMHGIREAKKEIEKENTVRENEAEKEIIT